MYFGKEILLIWSSDLLTLFYIFEFDFIFIWPVNWNHSEKLGVITFIEVLGPWHDPGVTRSVAWFLRLFFWSTPCSTYSSSTRKYAKSGSSCFSWPSFASNQNISFLCLIVAFASSLAVGFPDPGMPIFFIKKTIQRKLGDSPFLRSKLSVNPCLCYHFGLCSVPSPSWVLSLLFHLTLAACLHPNVMQNFFTVAWISSSY